jgi:SAM-dependent methyltransferase
MNSLFRTLVPQRLRPRFRKPYNYLRNKVYLRKVFGHHASMIPPLDLMHDGPVGFEEFKTNAEEFFRYYTKLCNLQPSERMLDIGCGIGRKTFLLTEYLNHEGSYDGLDIVKTGIDWCARRITRRYPRFKFQLIDVFNHHYNPSGTYKASEYKFPFADESFDFAVLCSVFTHMLPEDMEHYVCEVARVLRTGGRCLISFFLLNESSFSLMRANRNSIDLKIKLGHCWVADKNNPEAATGYDEDFVRAIFCRQNLEIKEPIHYGAWSGRENYLSYQDLVLAFKPAGDTRIRDDANNQDNLHFELSLSESISVGSTKVCGSRR